MLQGHVASLKAKVLDTNILIENFEGAQKRKLIYDFSLLLLNFYCAVDHISRPQNFESFEVKLEIKYSVEECSM